MPQSFNTNTGREEGGGRISSLGVDATTALAQSASMHPVLLRPDLAFAEGCKRIGWALHQSRNEVNRMGLTLNIRLSDEIQRVNFKRMQKKVSERGRSTFASHFAGNSIIETPRNILHSRQ